MNMETKGTNGGNNMLTNTVHIFLGLGIAAALCYGGIVTILVVTFLSVFSGK